MDQFDDDWMNAEHDMGTSIMAVVYNGGVVMGADSRTSTGSYVANRVSNKITPIHKKIYVCRSGSAADTQAVSEYVTYYLDIHGIELNQPPLVKTAAALCQQMVYNNKDHLTASIIVGGYDSQEGGQVYVMPLGGVKIRAPFAIGGSGSTYIYGWCDANFKENMSKEEALTFVRTALALAMARDGSSGGVIRTVVISDGPIEREMLPGNKLPKFWNQ